MDTGDVYRMDDPAINYAGDEPYIEECPDCGGQMEVGEDYSYCLDCGRHTSLDYQEDIPDDTGLLLS